jgi:2,4-dienoyl-CoA reductase-like NADH-dependent reductase (Old Yellow Enzyme family)
MKYEKLFQPITMRGVVFPNRLHRTSMVSGLTTENGDVTDDLIKRYQRKRREGSGPLSLKLQSSSHPRARTTSASVTTVLCRASPNWSRPSERQTRRRR